MGIFGKPDDRDQKITALEAETEDDAELLANEQQLRAAAEQRAAAMVLLRDPAKLDEAAQVAAETIDNFYAQGWDSAGRRKEAVQRLIRSFVQSALSGDEKGN